MNIRTAISIALIIFALGFTFFTFIRPIIKPALEEVSDGELYPIGKDADGEWWYIVVRQEAKEWVGILGQATPLLSLVLAYWLKKGRNK